MALQPSTSLDAPAAAEAPGAHRNAVFNAKLLLEMIVCDAHWCAMQVATLAIMTSICARPDSKAHLRSCRHLLHDGIGAMLLALRFGDDIGFSSEDTAKLAGVYRGVAEAQKTLRPLTETNVLTPSQRFFLQGQSAVWRRLAGDAAVALTMIEASSKAHLPACYADDAETLRQYLKRAAAGDTRNVDSAGIVQPPELSQRRRSPRVAVNLNCTLILPTGSIPATIRDVSANGLAIACRQPMAAGQKLVVALGDGRKLDAVVARAQDGKIGLSLSSALNPTDPLLTTGA